MKKTLIMFLIIISASTGTYTREEVKHNPLKRGTDTVFSDFFKASLELKDQGKDDEAFIKMGEAYSRAAAINEDIPAAISLYYSGHRYISLNRMDEAGTVLKKINEISSKNEIIDETDYWLYALHAEYSINMGQYSAALDYCEKAAAGIEKIYGFGNRFTIELYFLLGAANYYNGKTDRFLYYSATARQYSEKVYGADHLFTAIGFNNMGVGYDANGDYRRAIACYEKALPVYKKNLGQKHREIATCYNNLGTAYCNSGDIKTGIDYYTKAVALRTEILGEKHPDTAASCNDLGTAYKDAGDYDRAACYFSKALSLYIEIHGERHPVTATVYSNLGGMYCGIGDFDRAFDFYEKALSIRQETLGEKSAYTALCYNDLGWVFVCRSDYDRAIVYYLKALAIFRETTGDKHPVTATCLSNLGIAYANKLEYDRAIGYYENALAIRLETIGEKHPDTAAVYNNLAAAYQEKKDYNRALEYYEKALLILKEIFGEMHPNTAVSYNNIGTVYREKEDYGRAIEYYGKAQAIRLAVLGDKHHSVAIGYNNLGSAYDSMGNYEQAIKFYEKALLILQEKQSYQEVISFSQNLGYTRLKVRQYSKSFASFLVGIETIEKVRKLNLSGGTDFTSRNINSYYCAAAACFSDGDMNNMFNVSERMRAMGYIERLSLKAAIEASGIDPVRGKELLKLKDEIERLTALRHKLIAIDTYNMDDQQKKDLEIQFSDNSKQLAGAESGFNKLDSEFMKNEKYRMLRNSNVVSVKTARSLCGNDGAIIEYIIPDKPDSCIKPYAIIITGSSINAVELDSSYNYSGQIEKYRNAIKDFKKQEIDSIGAELYSVLIDPAAGFINSTNINRLIIVPDGSLAFLPFDSLKTGDNRYLSEKYELILTPSVTVSSITRSRKYDKRFNFMAFGGGLYSSKGENKTRGESSFRGIVIETEDREKLAAKAYNTPMDYYKAQQLNWADLPGTEREVLAINDRVYGKKNTDIYTGQGASEESLKLLSRTGKLKKYPSIHLACHGYYDPEYPAYSAVVFSEVSGKLKGSEEDGYMSVEETALLNLQSEIVVLSACETGLGRIVTGDGVIGLTRSFQVAGSNRVLVTLWPVSDESTEAFMISFYAKVMAGMSYSEALVNVKKEFRTGSGPESGDYSSPYFWAGFVLYE